MFSRIQGPLWGRLADQTVFCCSSRIYTGLALATLFKEGIRYYSKHTNTDVDALVVRYAESISTVLVCFGSIQIVG